MTSAARTGAKSVTCVQLRTDERGPFRVRFDLPPYEPTGACVIAQSGRLGAYDAPGEESLFYSRLTDALIQRGIAVVRHDAELRASLEIPATDEHVHARADRLRTVLEDPAHPVPAERRLICAFSLGAHAALQLLREPTLADAPSAAVLVGCVVEEPTVIMNGLRRVELVYGARDAIAYVVPGEGPAAPIFPERYGEDSARLLVVCPWQEVRCHVVPSAGHLLHDARPEVEGGHARWLAALLKDALPPVPSPVE